MDGSIGDRAHAARVSDHNPNAAGHVRAIDVDEHSDQTVGRALARFLIECRDPRIKYVIYEGRMFASYAVSWRPAWTWGPYYGSNKHLRHLHLSVSGRQGLYDDPSPWGFVRDVEENMIVPFGASGYEASSLQFELNRAARHLGLTATGQDGQFGPDTARLLEEVLASEGYRWDTKAQGGLKGYAGFLLERILAKVDVATHSHGATPASVDVAKLAADVAARLSITAT